MILGAKERERKKIRRVNRLFFVRALREKRQ